MNSANKKGGVMNYKINDIYNYSYRITITYEHKKLIGNIHAFNNETLKEKETTFDVLHALKNLNVYKYDENNIMKQNFENAFGINLKVKRGESYLIFVETIKNAIKNNPYFNIKDLENIGIDFNIHLNCIFRNNKNYIYNCNSVSEIVYSLLYYLFENEYKVNICRYCNRFFITDTYKNIFCKNDCPFPEKYKGMDCQYAKEQIMHSISSKRRRIYKYIESNSYNLDVLVNFKNECKKYKETIKISPSIWNINDYNNFIKKVDKYKSELCKK